MKNIFALMDSINFNQIINSLIDERMEKEKDNIQDSEYYEKLKNVIEDEKKALVDNNRPCPNCRRPYDKKNYRKIETKIEFEISQFLIA